MTASTGASASTPAPLANQAAQQHLDAIAAECSGDFGFYARDLRTGRTIARRADESFPTASLIKVAILVELDREGFPSVRLHHKIDFSALWHDARHLGEATSAGLGACPGSTPWTS